MSTEMDPERIFVVDGENAPLAVMSPEQVHLQGLRHRGFILLCKDRAGRLALRRLSREHPLHPGRWDVIGSGHVGAEQAAEEAAERCLPPALQHQEDGIGHARTLPHGAGTGDEIVEVFEVLLADEEARTLAADLEFMFVDLDEFASLVESYADQLTPDLLAVWTNRLFRHAL